MTLELSPGSSVIPRHVLRAELGVGEFGRVWSAIGPGNVAKALKFIQVDWSDPDRALREYLGVLRIRDVRGAFLVPLTDIWLLDAEGRVLDDDAMEMLDEHLQRSGRRMQQTMVAPIQPPEHIVCAMELCERTLSQVLAEHIESGRKGIPPAELMSYLRDAARGLDFLHEKRHPPLFGGTEAVSLSHGDVKPDNIMVIGDGAKLCDFTLAEALDSSGELLRKTMMKPAGTLFYMAPEVALGERGHTSDLYSLAITYYELRTNTLPFEDKALSSFVHLQEAKTKHRLEFPGVPDAEQRVLRKATSANPKKRYKTCREFADALDIAIGGTGSSPGRQAPERRTGWRPVAALLAVAALAAFFFLAPPGPDPGRVLQKLAEPGLPSIGIALDRMQPLTPAQAAELIPRFNERFQQDGAALSDDAAGFGERLRYLRYAAQFTDALPDADPAALGGLEKGITPVVGSITRQLRKDVDGVFPGDAETDPADLSDRLGKTTEVAKRLAARVNSAELMRSLAAIGFQTLRLEAREADPSAPFDLPDADTVPAADRGSLQCLALLSDVARRKADGEWPPRQVDEVKQLLRRVADGRLTDQATWESSRVASVRDEVIGQEDVELSWFIDQELAAAFLGPGQFDNRHMATIKRKLIPLRGREDYSSVLGGLQSGVEGASGDWIRGAGRSELEALIASELLAVRLRDSQADAFFDLIRDWSRQEPAMREAGLAAALDEDGGAAGPRRALLMALHEEFADEPADSAPFLDELDEPRLGPRVNNYAAYVRALRAFRDGRVDERLVEAFASAYEDAPVDDPQSIVGTLDRRAVAADALSRYVAGELPDGPPTDADLLQHNPLPEDVREAIRIYRIVAAPLEASTSEARAASDAAWLAALLIGGGVDEGDHAAARDSARRLLGTGLADGRTGILRLANALSWDTAEDRGQAASDLAAGLAALETEIETRDERRVRRRVLDPAESLADRLAQSADLSAATREALSDAYRRVAAGRARIAYENARELSKVYDLYTRANDLVASPSGEVDQALALIRSKYWIESESQLAVLRAVGTRHEADEDTLTRTGAGICLGMAAIGESRRITGDRTQRAERLLESINRLESAIAQLEPFVDRLRYKRQLVGCLSVKATAHVEYSFFSESSSRHLHDAITAAERALRIDPKHVQSYRALGNGHEDLALYQLESQSANYDAAVEAFSAANELLEKRLNGDVESLATRADLARCRKRWLAAGLYATREDDRRAEKQIAALLAESDRVEEVKEAARNDAWVAQRAAKLFFFLYQGLEACGEGERALAAAEACRSVADPDDPATGARWSVASLAIAKGSLESDPERARAIAEEVLANRHAPATSIWEAAALSVGDTQSDAFANKIAQAPAAGPDRAAELALLAAEKDLATRDASAGSDRLPELDALAKRAGRARAQGIPRVRGFDAMVDLLRVRAPFGERLSEFNEDRRPETAEALGRAVLALGEAIDKYDEAVLPDALFKALREGLAEDADADPLTEIALSRHHQATFGFRNAVWLYAAVVLRTPENRELTVAPQLLARLRESFDTALRVGDEYAKEYQSQVSQLLEELDRPPGP